MIRKIANTSISIAALLFLIINLFGLHLLQVNGIKFEPVPFNKVPVAMINSSNGNYNIGADFSIDYGDETAMKKANDPIYAKDMYLYYQFRIPGIHPASRRNSSCCLFHIVDENVAHLLLKQTSIRQKYLLFHDYA